ncbi:flavin-containing monooxygenase [Marinobacter orientalis]|uniref:NAD(P)/FAD-dependent oxidoreductase n=1 Tax=Marinobacter orientalis TaxID=1928859 RepID=A0A7Y0WTK1_9GAMM|nr:NAD(P)/FAD-dependent oxidoreductase [Marinobacter orientalis]NMT64947.1 NAD(P)/FAD-dependent oxidoreductase [Marinobacter orientalis]TGX48158.1 NAD(P)/FAD-dependent oxidoreductase [Marinobacter orientalis]
MNQAVNPSMPSIVIIGTGFGGLGMAIQLRNSGLDSFILLEKASAVGGTWRDNTYPGAACDVQSHLYSFSFEPRHDWSRKFGLQPEILGYMQHCVDKYGLADHIRFNKEVASAAFDEATNTWTVITTDGESFTADIVITATGQLNQPAWPNIPGMETFSGRMFHSARWDHDYDLKGKNVGVIGTGASAIQFVPEIVPRVKSLSLFQRSAAWVLPKPDRPFYRWEQTLFRRIPAWDRFYRYLIYWKNESRALAFTRFNSLLEIFAWQAKRFAKSEVRDPHKLRHLIPDYKIGCKRILISNDWYRAVDQPHVNLVTTGIERIASDGIVTSDGALHKVDTLIMGTGFAASEFLSPMDIKGRNGLSLNQAWANGSEAYKGITVSGFPNLFILYGPNTNLAHNSIVYMLESQFQYVLSCIETLQAQPGIAMDVKPDRLQVFSATTQQKLQTSVWDSGCHSWYLDRNGKNTVNWPGFTFTYRKATRQVNPDDYDFLQPS